MLMGEYVCDARSFSVIGEVTGFGYVAMFLSIE